MRRKKLLLFFLQKRIQALQQRLLCRVAYIYIYIVNIFVTGKRILPRIKLGPRPSLVLCERSRDCGS